MKIWVIAFIVSLLLVLIMGALFAFGSMVALNGFMSMSGAMPTFLICNAVVWPIMVGVGTAVNWIIFLIAKQKPSFKRIILLNAVLVTLLLGALILAASFM